MMGFLEWLTISEIQDTMQQDTRRLVAAALPSVMRSIKKVVDRIQRSEGIPLDADDISQEVARKAIEGNFKGDMGNYMWGIARNVIRDELRRSARAGEPIDIDIPQHFNPSADLEREEGKSRIHAAIERLPDRQQQIVKLHLQGMSPAEIAKTLNVDPITARTTMTFARRALKDILRHEAHILEGPDTLGPGGMHTSKQGHEDQEGLAHLNPVLEPIPKSLRSKKIEKLFGKIEGDKNVAQDRERR